MFGSHHRRRRWCSTGASHLSTFSVHLPNLEDGGMETDLRILLQWPLFNRREEYDAAKSDGWFSQVILTVGCALHTFMVDIFQISSTSRKKNGDY